MTGAGSLLLHGTEASCAVLLFLAGATKLRSGDGGQATACRLFRVSPRRCRPALAAAGVAECVTAVLVGLGWLPVASSAAMTAMGATFVAVTLYARGTGAAGDCGCIRWRYASRAGDWRATARAGCVVGAGIAALLAGPPRPASMVTPWFGAGLVGGGIILALLTVTVIPRSARCRRRLWLPTRDALQALVSHPVFEVATGSTARPARAAFAHERDGCTDSFFLADPGEPGHGTVFRVSRDDDGSVAVLASVRNHPAGGGVLTDTRPLVSAQ